MGVNYSVGGAIRIRPALTEDQRTPIYRCLGNIVLVRGAKSTRLEVENGRVGDVEELASEVQDIIDAVSRVPGLRITGRFDVEGADARDLCRIKVTGPDDDRVCVVFTPTITWPEESE